MEDEVVGLSPEERHLARPVSIVTEFNLLTMDRVEYVGDKILNMTDEQAGQWIKHYVEEAVRTGLKEAL